MKLKNVCKRRRKKKKKNGVCCIFRFKKREMLFVIYLFNKKRIYVIRYIAMCAIIGKKMCKQYFVPTPMGHGSILIFCCKLSMSCKIFSWLNRSWNIELPPVFAVMWSVFSCSVTIISCIKKQIVRKDVLSRITAK